MFIGYLLIWFIVTFYMFHNLLKKESITIDDSMAVITVPPFWPLFLFMAMLVVAIYGFHETVKSIHFSARSFMLK